MNEREDAIAQHLLLGFWLCLRQHRCGQWLLSLHVQRLLRLHWSARLRSAHRVGGGARLVSGLEVVWWYVAGDWSGGGLHGLRNARSLQLWHVWLSSLARARQLRNASVWLSGLTSWLLVVRNLFALCGGAPTLVLVGRVLAL